MERPSRHSPRYGRVAIALHWSIAALILFNLAVGFFMEGWPPAARRLVVSLHVSSGLTVLALTAIRIAWRIVHRPPAFDPSMARWERITAKLVHGVLYAGMIVVPLSGWALVSANPPPGSPGAAAADAAREVKAGHRAGRPVDARRSTPKVWWVLPRPSIAPLQRLGETPEGVAPQKQLHDSLVSFHSRGAVLLIIILALHIGGALKHQFFDGQEELARMGVRRRRPREASRSAQNTSAPATSR